MAMPGLDELFRAADAHAAEAGDHGHAVGDLQGGPPGHLEAPGAPAGSHALRPARAA